MTQHFQQALALAALAAALPCSSALANVSLQDTFDVEDHGVERGVDLPGPLGLGDLTGLQAGLLIDEPGDGRTWARGPQWKASFGPEGMTYIPFFGSDAPKSYPIEFNLSRATNSGDAIALLPRSRERNGNTVLLDRGSVTEAYHLTGDTVEQTFVFDELSHRGEIVLEIDVDTELYAATGAQGGLTFSNELGEVHYGRALALDAAGRAIQLHQELTATGIRIVVPEDYVAIAEMPLVVDPILTTLSFTPNSRRQLSTDVTFEGGASTYQIVYAEIQSAFDYDVIAVNYSPVLGTFISIDAIDITSELWDVPHSASSFHQRQFLCASIVGRTTGSREVWGRTQDADTGVRGPQFQISGPGAVNVDVGGKGNNVNSVYDYMVVWQETDGLNLDFDIVAQAVSGDSTLTAGRITIDGDVDDLDRFPTISKTTGRFGLSNPDSEYMIVWEREITPTNRNIRAQVIEYTGSMSGHNQFNAYTFSDSRHPDVSSQTTINGYAPDAHWVLAFERLTGSDYDIFTVVARDGNADNARSVNTMQNLDVDRDHRSPAIAFDGQDYHIAYQTEAPNGDRVVHITTANIAHDGGELRTGLALRRETLALSEGAPADIGIASLYDGGASTSTTIPEDVMVVWSTREASTNDSDIEGALYEDGERLNLGSQYCVAAVNSTGTSAWMAARGNTWQPSSIVNLEASDLPPFAFGHFICSTTSGFVVTPGGSQGNLCLQGSVGRFNRPGEIMNSGAAGFIEIDADMTDLPSPSGAVAALPGETWYFQCWVRDIGSNSNFTNAIGVTFD